MLSVSALIDLLARVTDIPQDIISRHARSLIDGNILPKSRGRTIATVSPENAFQLLIALGATDRPSDAPRIVERYWNMTPLGLITAGYNNFGEHGAFLISEASKFNYDVWTKLSDGYIQIERHYPGGSIKEGRKEPLRYLPADSSRDGKRPGFLIEAKIHGINILIVAAGLAGMSYPDAVDEVQARHDRAVDPS